MTLGLEQLRETRNSDEPVERTGSDRPNGRKGAADSRRFAGKKPEINPSLSGKSLETYLKEIGRIPLLPPEEVNSLAATMEECLEKLDDQEGHCLGEKERAELQSRYNAAFERLVVHNLRLVVGIAKALAERAEHLELLDLIQEGNFGLMIAVKGFDYKKGFKFSTYATDWIKQTIHRAFGNTDREIRLPIHVLDERRRQERTRRQLAELLGRRVSDEELAEFLDIETEKIDESRQAHKLTDRADSLDEPVMPDSDTTLSDLVADRHSPGPEQTAIEAIEEGERETQAAALLARLDPIEKEVIKLCHGFEGQSLTLRDIGRKLNLPDATVRGLKSRAEAKLLRATYRQSLDGGRPRPPIDYDTEDQPAVIEFEYDQPTVMTEMTLGKLTIRLAREEQPPADTSWLQYGHCLHFDDAVFFPAKGEPPDEGRAVCRRCPVKTPCLEHALDQGRLYPGTWGATGLGDRRRIRTFRLRLADQTAAGNA